MPTVATLCALPPTQASRTLHSLLPFFLLRVLRITCICAFALEWGSLASRLHSFDSSSILNRHLMIMFDMRSCRYLHYLHPSIIVESIADIHSMLVAITFHCSNRQLLLQHINISTRIISSSMGNVSLPVSFTPPMLLSPLMMHCHSLIFHRLVASMRAAHLLEWRMMRSEWRSIVRVEAAICG